MRNVLIGFLLGVGTTLIISYIRAYIKNAKYESTEGLNLELLEKHRDKLSAKGLIESANEFQVYIDAYKTKKSLLKFFRNYRIKCRIYREQAFPDHPHLGGYNETGREYFIEPKFIF
jgi:hypothetical protein